MAMAFPSSRSETSSYSYSSAFASSSVASFASRASPPTMQSSSSANIRLHGHRSPPSPSSSVRFSMEQRPASPGRRSMTVTKDMRNNNAVSSSKNSKRTCMCAPTTHPGSFRCAYHKRLAEQEQEQQRQQQQQQQQQLQQKQQRQQTASSRSRTLNLRRSAMKNSLVRIGVEGELVKRTLTTLIRPSSHQLRRREAFQARPSRFSLMSKAQDSS